MVRWLWVLGLKREGREQRNNARERERALEWFNKSSKERELNNNF